MPATLRWTLGDASTDGGDGGDAGDGGINAPASALVLSNNAGEQIIVSTDGTFDFPTPLASGTMFDVEIVRQPIFPLATCSLMGNTGTVLGGDVSSISVNCTPAMFNLGGSVDATLKGSGMVLSDGLGQTVTINATGTFAFPLPEDSGQTYNVTVTTPPANPTQSCTVTRPSGMITTAAVSNVALTCTTNKYNVGYNVTGLAGTGLVLTDTVGTATMPTDSASITANGAAKFPTQVTSGIAYSVSVKTQPSTPQQTCTLGGGTGTTSGGTVTNADVSIAVACKTNTYAVSGAVSGLPNTATMKVTNNGADEQTITGTAAASVGFAFPTAIASGATYSLAISAQPTGQYCTFANGSGTITTAAVTNLAVTCRAQEAIGVVYSDPNSADVIASLTATNAFTSVTGFDASLATPTLAQLQAWTSVLVYSSAPFSSAANLGNVLGTYLTTIPTGGTAPGRVVGAAEINLTSNAIAGTFASTYFELKVGTAASGPDGLNKIDVTTTPLMSGVNTLTASVAIHGTQGNNGTKVAEWGDTSALVATGTYKIGTGTTVYNRADLNFYPVSSKINANYWKGDGAQLLVNALLYR